MRFFPGPKSRIRQEPSVEQFFFQPGKIFFPIFPGATFQKNNEISNQDNFLGLRKDRKKLEKVFLRFLQFFLFCGFQSDCLNFSFLKDIHSYK